MVDALNKLADVIVQELLDLPVILVGVCFGETLGDKMMNMQYPEGHFPVVEIFLY